MEKRVLNGTYIVQEEMGDGRWIDIGPEFPSYEAAHEWATIPAASWIRPYRIVQVIMVRGV